jgi:hypothetical protein
MSGRCKCFRSLRSFQSEAPAGIQASTQLMCLCMLAGSTNSHHPAAVPATPSHIRPNIFCFLLPCLQVSQTQPSDSFVHLHAVVHVPPGSDPSQLPVHSYFLAPGLVGDTGWPTLTIATAVDDTLAPPGKQVLLTLAATWCVWRCWG